MNEENKERKEVEKMPVVIFVGKVVVGTVGGLALVRVLDKIDQRYNPYRRSE